MSLRLHFSLDDLVQLYAQGSKSPEPYASPECAHDVDRYDHRSLYEFTAELDYACRRAAAPVPDSTEPPSGGDHGLDPV